MNETPEAVRDRTKAEELAKGSDPRVAEGRAKAAEMRARHGLPIEPQEAWKAKLAQEGGAPSAPAAAAPAAAAAAPPEAASAEPAPAEPAAEPAAAPSAQPEPKAEGAPPATPAAEAPSAEPATEPAAAPAAAAAEPQPQPAPTATAAAQAPSDAPATPAAPSPPVAPVFEPEVGEVIEPEDEVVFTVGGVKVRDARIATWILILLLAIPLWAMLYLLALGGADVGQSTTGCIVEPDRSFICFQPKHESEAGGGH